MSENNPLIFFSIFLALCGEISAQYNSDSSTRSQPKIGLVLSGGGARGFAHIGVLKVLEEQGIRPDYITGNSMGALVAALYSLGYSACQLEEFVIKADWNDLLTDKITLRDIPAFEKNDYPGYPLKMFFKGAKPTLPSGMIRGQKVQALFSKLVWPSFNYTDFDAFPIPYRCIATDIISGQDIVFKDGNLAEAMRSSMSIPTIFTPVERDSMMLVDGGVINNFPVQECLDMGADLIIGVYTGFEKNPNKEDLQSMVQLLSRISVFQGIANAKTQVKKADLLIIPNLDQFGIEGFNRVKSIIAAGEAAARDSIVIRDFEKIAALVHPIDTIIPFIDTSSIWIDKIAITGNQRIDSHTITKMSGLEKGSYLNAEDIDKGVKRIYASWQFDKVTYHISSDTAEQILTIEVDEGSRGYLNIGIHYDNSYGPSVLFRAAYKDIYLKSSIASINLSISENPQFRLSYKYYPTKKRKLELSLNTYLQYNKMPDIFTEENITYHLGHYRYTHADFNMALFWSPFRNTMLQVSGGNQLNKIVLKEGMEVYYNMNKRNYNVSFLSLNFNLNTLDDPFFPTKGTYLDIKGKSTFNAKMNKSDTTSFLGVLSARNTMFTFDFKQYIRIKRRFSIIPELAFGLMSAETFLTEKFFLGGLNYNLRPNVYNFGGIRSNYIATDNFIIAGIGCQYKFLLNWYLQLGAQGLVFANYADFEAETDEEFEDNTFGSWNAGVGYYSKLGPLRLVVSKSPERNEYVWSINIGIPF